MALCIHDLVPTTCWCCLYGAFAPTMWEAFEPAAPTLDYPEGDFWGKAGGGGGCPSERDYEAARSYNEHWPNPKRPEIYRGKVKHLSTVQRPTWLAVEFTKSPAFLGFYRNDLSAIAGHGIDPEFMSVH